jgi:kinesin family member 6/9
LIKNEALVNEELDPKLIINKLKREIEELKNQLAISQTEYNPNELTNYETDKYV